eukprot:352258-Chlamydomonas_euryale.AAC.2
MRSWGAGSIAPPLAILCLVPARMQGLRRPPGGTAGQWYDKPNSTLWRHHPGRVARLPWRHSLITISTCCCPSCVCPCFKPSSNTCSPLLMQRQPVSLKVPPAVRSCPNPDTNSTEAAASTAGAGDVHAALLTQHSESSDRAGRRGGGGIGGGAPPLKSAAPPGSGTCGGGEGAGGDGLACGPPLPLLAAWRAGEAAATAVGGADASSGSAAAVPSLPLSLCNHSGGDGSSSGDGLPAGWSLLPSTQLHMMCAYNVPFMATHACLNPQVWTRGGVDA